MKYLLKNGTVVSGDKSEKLDVLVDGEKIVNVGKDLESDDAEVIDVKGKLLFPGFIDGHTHFDLEVAGTVTADDFETGTRAALLGGTTLVIDYASQDKGGHTLKEGLDKWHKKADGKCSCDYSFHMSIVEWNDETEAEVQDMIDHGITSFKLYMTYPAMIVNDCDMYKILKKLGECGCFAGVHCENAGVIDALISEAKKEGRLGPENHPLVRPDTMEAEAVHRLLVIAKEANAPVMVVHLTNKKAYEEVMNARKERTGSLCRDLPAVSPSGRQRILQAGLWRCCLCMCTADPQERRSGLPVESSGRRGDPDGGNRPVQLSLWHRKPSEKMTSPRSREDFRAYRQEEPFSILTESRPERSHRNRCAKSSAKTRPNCTAYIRTKVRSQQEAMQIS